LASNLLFLKLTRKVWIATARVGRKVGNFSKAQLLLGARQPQKVENDDGTTLSYALLFLEKIANQEKTLIGQDELKRPHRHR
jgi:hypothetical protein